MAMRTLSGVEVSFFAHHRTQWSGPEGHRHLWKVRACWGAPPLIDGMERLERLRQLCDRMEGKGVNDLASGGTNEAIASAVLRALRDTGCVSVEVEMTGIDAPNAALVAQVWLDDEA